METPVTTSATAGGAADGGAPNTSAKRIATSTAPSASKPTERVSDMPLSEWLLMLATTVKRYEQAGGEVAYYQHKDGFVIQLLGVAYDEAEQALYLEQTF